MPMSTTLSLEDNRLGEVRCMPVLQAMYCNRTIPIATSCGRQLASTAASKLGLLTRSTPVKTRHENITKLVRRSGGL